jgi:hypothetical protein
MYLCNLPWWMQVGTRPSLCKLFILIFTCQLSRGARSALHAAAAASTDISTADPVPLRNALSWRETALAHTSYLRAQAQGLRPAFFLRQVGAETTTVLCRCTVRLLNRIDPHILTLRLLGLGVLRPGNPTRIPSLSGANTAWCKIVSVLSRISLGQGFWPSNVGGGGPPIHEVIPRCAALLQARPRRSHGAVGFSLCPGGHKRSAGGATIVS